MVQSTLGAGVLTLPFALSQAGIIIGMELLLAACTLNFMAGWAIARASQETRMSSFSGLSALISRHHGVVIFLDIATIVLVLGIVSSCLFVFGDSLEDMLQASRGNGQRFFFALLLIVEVDGHPHLGPSCCECEIRLCAFF